jgi:hypothetical protein
LNFVHANPRIDNEHHYVVLFCDKLCNEGLRQGEEDIKNEDYITLEELAKNMRNG